MTKPRTVCAFQPVVAMISADVAPLGRFISAITSALLLARLAFGLPAGFLYRSVFLVAWFSWLPRVSACQFMLVGCVLSVDCVIAPLFLVDRVAVVTSITRVERNCAEVFASRRMELAGSVPVFYTRQNDVLFPLFGPLRGKLGNLRTTVDNRNCVRWCSIYTHFLQVSMSQRIWPRG